MPTALGLPHCLCVSLGPAGVANVAPSRTHAEAPRPGTARSAGPPTGTLLLVGGTETERGLLGVLERGGLIATAAAGRTIQGSYLVRSRRGDIYAASGRERAFDYLQIGAVDQHVNAWGQDRDLAPLAAARPELLGIGLDEVVMPSSFRGRGCRTAKTTKVMEQGAKVMDDIADLRCIALRLVRDIRTGTGQLGIFLNRLLRLPQLSECGGALQDRAADPNETPERERRAWEAVEEIWKAAFSPRLFPA